MSVIYIISCEKCGRGMAIYIGECRSNGYARGLEHIGNLGAKDEEKSEPWPYCKDYHQAREGVKFIMRVEGAYKEVLGR